MPTAPSFGASLATPGSFGNKKNLLKKMVRNIKPTKMSIKKASMKSILASGKGASMNGSKVKPSLTGGSPFKLNAGLGTPDSAQISPATLTSGAGANLGKTGAF